MAYNNPSPLNRSRRPRMPRISTMPQFGSIDPQFGVPSNMQTMPEFNAVDPRLGVPTNMRRMPEPGYVDPRFGRPAKMVPAPTPIAGPGLAGPAGPQVMPSFDSGIGSIGDMAANRMGGTGMRPMADDPLRRERIRQMALDMMARFGR